jgi:hypothetical protein
VRTLAGQPSSSRPTPGANLDENDLTDTERRHAAGLMRVNHTGEVCAQALYAALSKAHPQPGLLERARAEIVTILAALYARYGEIDALRRILAGVSCAAVGLLISAVFRMMMPLVKQRDLIGLVILAAVFIAVGLLRLPLPVVLLVASPVSIAIAFVVRRGAA